MTWEKWKNKKNEEIPRRNGKKREEHLLYDRWGTEGKDNAGKKVVYIRSDMVIPSKSDRVYIWVLIPFS